MEKSARTARGLLPWRTWMREGRSTRLGTRLAAGLALLLVLLAGVVATALEGLHDTSARVRDLATVHLPKVIEANLVVDRANETARTLAEMALLQDAGTLAQRRARIHAARGDAAARLARLRSQPLTVGEAGLMDDIEAARRDYLDSQDRFLRLIEHGERDTARAVYASQLRPRQETYVDAISVLTRYQGDLAARENALAQRRVRRAQAWLATIAGIAIAFGALFGVLLVRSITRPLATAVGIAERISGGELDLPRETSPRGDEVRQLLQALRTMAGKLAAERTDLVESRELLAQSQAQARLGSWWYEPESGRLVLSDEARRLFGVQPGDAVDEAWLASRVHPDDRASLGHFRRSAQDGQAHDAEYRLVVDDAVVRVRARSELRPAGPAHPPRVLCTLQDISLLRHREAELLESREQLRGLAAHHEREREELRTTLSRELHDQIGQYLTVLRLDAAMLRRRFGHLDPEIEPLVATMKRSIDHAMALLRDVVAALRPAPLNEGLVPAAEWLLSGFARRTGIDCRLDAADPDLELEGALATAAFRILQEALTNVGRHAQASRLRVGIAAGDGALRLEITDDGIGFDPRKRTSSRSFGLLGMRERALMFGGTLAIDSAPGHGTTLRITLPLGETAPA